MKVIQFLELYGGHSFFELVVVMKEVWGYQFSITRLQKELREEGIIEQTCGGRKIFLKGSGRILENYYSRDRS